MWQAKIYAVIQAGRSKRGVSKMAGIGSGSFPLPNGHFKRPNNQTLPLSALCGKNGIDNRKGGVQWETKAERRIRTRARNRKNANRTKRIKRSRIINRKKLRKARIDPGIVSDPGTRTLCSGSVQRLLLYLGKVHPHLFRKTNPTRYFWVFLESN